MKKTMILITALALAPSIQADTATELTQLQTQITQLQAELTHNEASEALIATDTDDPFGLLPSTTFGEALLAEQSQFPATLTLGAAFSADVQIWGGSNLPDVFESNRYSSSGSAIAATTADLSTLANFNAWTQVFMTVQGGLNGYPSQFSEVILNFGNLKRSPFYATVGYTELPFGTFPGGGLVASTLEANTFESGQVNQFDLGFSQANLNLEGALFNGKSNLNDFVLSLQDQQTVQAFSFGEGLGYMNDLRYSGSSIAAAYDTSHGYYNVPRSILNGGANGAVDFYASAAYNFNSQQSLTLSGEWDSTTTSPNVRNHPTGKMQAWTVVGSYASPLFGKSTTFSIDYSATVNMAAVPMQLPMPVNTQSPSVPGIKNQWLAFAQTEVANNVYLGPEWAWLNLQNNRHAWESALNLSVYL